MNVFSPSFIKKVIDFYNKFVSLLVMLTIPIIIFTLIMAVIIIIFDLRYFITHFTEELTHRDKEAFKYLIINVLNFFVLVELFRMFLDVIEYQRLRKRQMIEAGIIFVLREIIISLFSQKFDFLHIAGFSILLLSLAIAFVLMNKMAREGAVAYRWKPIKGEKQEKIKRLYRSMTKGPDKHEG